MPVTTQTLPPATRSADLQVQQLLTFRSVYELGGYSAAAEHTGMSVPAAWQQIQGLERCYSVELFQKVGRRIEPTHAADRLYRVLDDILTSLESTFDLVQRDACGKQQLTLVTGVRMLMEDLAAPLQSFRCRYDQRLMIRHGNNRRAEEMLLTGEADLAMSLEARPQMQSDAIHYEPAYLVEFFAVAPKRHPWTSVRSGSLQELVKHPLIVTAEGTHGRDALEQALYREQLTADIPVETDNSAFTIACVRAGMGVGIVAGRREGSLCSRLVTRSLRRHLGRRQIVFMWRSGRLLSDAEKGLVELVRQHHGGTQV